MVTVTALFLDAAMGETFRDSLSETDFETRRLEWAGRITEARGLAEKGIPAVGSMVNDVVSGTKADELGFQFGDIVSIIDGQALWGEVKWKQRTGPAELIHFARSGERTVFEVPPGIVGFYKGYFNAPELDFLRERTGTSAGGELALLGLIAIDEDPALAEASWLRAMQSGYQSDEFSRYSELLLSIGRNSFFNLVTAYHDDFVVGQEVRPCFLEGLVSAATSCGHIKMLKTLRGQLEEFYWTEEELDQLEGFAGGVEPPEEDLLTRVRRMPYRVVGGELQNDPRYSEIESQAGVELFSRNSGRISVRQNRIRRAFVNRSEPLENVHISVSIREIGVSELNKRHGSAFKIALAHGDYERLPGRGNVPRNDMNLITTGIEFLDHSADRVRVPNFYWRTSGLLAKWRTNASSLYYPRTLSDGSEVTAARDVYLDLIRLDSEVACYVNGKRFLGMPVDATAEDLTIAMSFTGCSASSFDCIVREILPPR